MNGSPSPVTIGTEDSVVFLVASIECYSNEVDEMMSKKKIEERRRRSIRIYGLIMVSWDTMTPDNNNINTNNILIVVVTYIVTVLL